MSTNMQIAAKINATDVKISYVANNLKMDYNAVLLLVSNIMNKTLEYTLIDVKKWIEVYVAKDTGTLQQSLIDTLFSSKYLNNLLRLELGSNLPYAAKINSDRTLQLQHQIDPQAQHGFMGLLKMEARKRLRDNFKRARFELCGAIGVSAAPISRVFKVAI